MPCTNKLKVFLDDEREPPGDDWTVCRNIKEFSEALDKQWPDVVSFDHDLSLDKYTFVNQICSGLGHVYKDVEDTGMNAVKLLIDCHINLPPWVKFPKCLFHTANPVGRDNMKSYVDSYVERHLINE